MLSLYPRERKRDKFECNMCLVAKPRASDASSHEVQNLYPDLCQEVAELVFTVMLQQGHKTPTHMAKILAGCMFCSSVTWTMFDGAVWFETFATDRSCVFCGPVLRLTAAVVPACRF